MAYRVTTEPVNRAVSGVSRRRPHNTFNRNVAIAGVTLGCLCFGGAAVAVLGRAHETGSLPNYVASHKALKIAWAEPEQQAQFERNPMLATNSPSLKSQSKTQPVADLAGPAAGPQADAPVKMASRFDAAFGALGDNAPAISPSQVPLPHARPRRAVAVAAIPLPRDRVAEPAEIATATPDLAPPATEPAAVVAEQTPAEAAEDAKGAKANMTLMSYAPPTREQIFAPEVTGSIGNSLRDLADKPAHPVVPPVKPPAVKPLSKIMPEIKPAKPAHKLTLREKLWGPVQVASLGPLDGLGRDNNGIPKAPYDRQTAVYVITDKKVYMPDGTVLEAHSGLGDKMDDPRFASVRMRGVTPPHVYDLKLRESLFHGVEAIRMLPMGGEDAIFGRDGILAHTYMLGPSGQSNGCVSFKDYDTFLDAFKAGKVNRLAVISRLD
jgi:hypothetical protein